MTFPKYAGVTAAQWLSTPLDEKTKERTQDMFNRLPLGIPGVMRPSILDIGCGHGGEGSLYSLLKPSSGHVTPRSEWHYRGFDALQAKIEAFRLWAPEANVWVQNLYDGPVPEVDIVWCNLIKLGGHQAEDLKPTIDRLRALARYGVFMTYVNGSRGGLSTYIHFEVHKPGELDIFYHCEVHAQ